MLLTIGSTALDQTEQCFRPDGAVLYIPTEQCSVRYGVLLHMVRSNALYKNKPRITRIARIDELLQTAVQARHKFHFKLLQLCNTQ